MWIPCLERGVWLFEVRWCFHNKTEEGTMPATKGPTDSSCSRIWLGGWSTWTVVWAQIAEGQRLRRITVSVHYWMEMGWEYTPWVMWPLTLITWETTMWQDRSTMCYRVRSCGTGQEQSTHTDCRCRAFLLCSSLWGRETPKTPLNQGRKFYSNNHTF